MEVQEGLPREVARSSPDGHLLGFGAGTPGSPTRGLRSLVMYETKESSNSMPDNLQPRHDVTPKDTGLVSPDLGEAIYARHAQFVWPTSIASSLAHRYAPFTEKRLPLATTLHQR